MDSDIEHPTETTALLPKEPTALSPSPSNTSVSTTDVTVDKCGRPQSSSSYGSSSFVRNLQCISSFTVSWHNLTVKKIGSDKLILDNVCGVAKSGQFVALMGASGAGKTTLLNTLLSRNLKNLQVSGNVLVDGRELGREITYVSGYVQQDELFVPNLTVREHLMIQARLRLVDFSEDQIRRRVSEIIKELGLRKCEHSRIGLSGVKRGISGGEMRRLSFASELLSNPAVLFCDEPTTGLDSSMAESVVNVMAKLCKNGRTIICTIHQPSSIIFRKFDRVMFLAKGRLACFGEPMKMVELFERFGYPCPANYNPSDMIIAKLSVTPHNEYVCLERIQKICVDFAESSEGETFYHDVAKCRLTVGKMPEIRKTASYFVQTQSLFKRSILDNWRNPAFARAKIIQKIIMGLFIGLLYFQTPFTPVGISNLNGGLFYIIAELTYSTMFGVLTFLPQDYPLLVREYHDGLYGVLSYYCAKCLSYVPLFSIDGWIMVTLAYWMMGLVPTVFNFLAIIVISFLVEQAASAFGVMLSATMPSYAVAVSIAGPIVTILSLTGGFFANIGELPIYVSWTQYLSWFRYGFESLSILQWVGAAAYSGRNCIGVAGGGECREANSILKQFSFDVHNLYFNVVSMIGITLLFYAIGFFGLYLRVRKSR